MLPCLIAVGMGVVFRLPLRPERIEQRGAGWPLRLEVGGKEVCCLCNDGGASNVARAFFWAGYSVAQSE